LIKLEKSQNSTLVKCGISFNFKKMKKIKLLFLLISSFTFSQSSITGKVVYNVYIEPVNLDKIFSNKSLSQNQKNKIISVIDNQKNVNYQLTFNKKEALYKKQNQSLKSDDDKSINITEIVAGGTDAYYTPNPLKIALWQRKMTGDIFLISYPVKQWILKQDVKKINNFSCYKAILSKKSKKEINQTKPVIVWYTPNIPVPFGPKDYNGLPGLVLEVHVGKLVFKATKIIINPKEKINIVKPKKGIKLTKKEYDKKTKQLLKNMGFN